MAGGARYRSVSVPTWPDDDHIDDLLDKVVVLTMVDGQVVHVSDDLMWSDRAVCRSGSLSGPNRAPPYECEQTFPSRQTSPAAMPKERTCQSNLRLGMWGLKRHHVRGVAVMFGVVSGAGDCRGMSDGVRLREAIDELNFAEEMWSDFIGFPEQRSMEGQWSTPAPELLMAVLDGYGHAKTKKTIEMIGKYVIPEFKGNPEPIPDNGHVCMGIANVGKLEL
ncbi:hypothetical protein [Actinomadura sp. 3N407]|uniref:hypothetical protein n=1 Tax=Actinomadura sp. 3N407 TaxID=3457423 RepID=UPI003FCD9507